MNSYPDDYIVHNLPLVILTGLEPNNSPETPFGEKSYEFLGDGGFRIRAELPPLRHPLTPDLRSALLSHDKSKAAWRPQAADKADQVPAFKIRSVGRVGRIQHISCRMWMLNACRHTRFLPVKLPLHLTHHVSDQLMTTEYRHLHWYFIRLYLHCHQALLCIPMASYLLYGSQSTSTDCLLFSSLFTALFAMLRQLLSRITRSRTRSTAYAVW